MLKIAIIAGSTRPQRKALDVAKWVYRIASQRADASFEIVDLAELDLPLLDEPLPPSMGKYANAHTQAWAAKVAPFDAFVFVTPEYNHGTSAALKNAIDYLYREWNDKAAGFVSYGSAGGTRAVEQLRTVMAELQIAHVRAQVMLTLAEDFQEYKTFTPRPDKEQSVTTMLDQLVSWGTAMQSVRSSKESRAAAE